MKPQPKRISTKFQKSIKDPGEAKSVLKPGSNNIKLGGKVTKGRWKDMPIYSLTLVERETCPSDCLHWDNCYGNNMPFAHRYKVTEDLMPLIFRDLNKLSKKHRHTGFVVRLHILGDFYSEEYVRFWYNCLFNIPNLHIWGYTARRDDIGKAVDYFLNKGYPDRCVIRYSYPIAYNGLKYASNKDLGKDSFACPEQTNKVDNCGSCGACWESKKTVYFKEH